MIKQESKVFFNYFLVLIITGSFLFISCKDQDKANNLVTDVEMFNAAVANAKPGDEIVLANGVWNDTELVFDAKGTAEHPITLTVEEKGKVTLEGRSNLQIAGEHLIIKGLVFKNGYTPTNAVISFRKNREELANNCRLTECVIDNFNNPERHVQDYWVTIYGKNNRLDHNHIVGKKNLGVTMIVGLDTKGSVENNHQIDHNYFGPRPTFGNNGGETLRIGTSHHALENSGTIVESNYFDRCNGEIETVSSKSANNIYRYNTFFECTGTLTMRHGNETLVEGNVFLGNNKPNTGGIRIINEDQIVRNNYLFGVTGYRFRGAFVVMNGVPNSTPNRYMPVMNSKLLNNTYVNCDNILFCAGSDEERSSPPTSTEISGNIFYHDHKDNIFTAFDDVSGISFHDNIVGENINTDIASGFTPVNLKLVKNDQGFLIPTSDQIKNPIVISDKIGTKDNTGTTWYSKDDKTIALNSGQTIAVEPGINTLSFATAHSNPGDVIELTSGETYVLTKSAKVKHPLTFKSSGKEKAIILFERMMAFEIENGGSLSLENLKFNGASSPDYAGNAVISTSKKSMTENYKLFIDGCDFEDLIVNHSFDVLRVGKGTFADTISIQNSKFKNITGHIAALDAETDDIGAYNAEYVIMKNNILTDVQGVALRLYRGGTDESTLGPFLEMENNVFNHVGFGKKNKYNAALSLYGVQSNRIENNIFNETKPVEMHLVVGEPIVNILNNDFYKVDDMRVTGNQKYTVANSLSVDPKFSNTDTFELSTDSPLKGKGVNGKDLGIIK
ncbi:polysaccharide lyase 6 family protein [Formosa sp. 3Alg 14/1]|uniref:polysaccharide lyase 6 family protein n=1 Tax=Formosa sp. 3Alg 14/1 TaxID=3382190 RepID=UPI0039BE2ED2